MWPQAINKLYVRGFKTFADAAVDLKATNLLIGANGAGKSNVLSLLKLLRSLGHGELQVYVSKSGGANDVLCRTVPPTKALELGLDLTTITGSTRYGLLAERTDDDRLLLRSEHLERFDFDGSSRGAEQHNKPVHESPLSDPARRASEHGLFVGLRVYHFVETAVSAPASFECDVDDNQELREDGANLAAFLLMLSRTHTVAYGKIIRTIQQVLSGFGEFVLKPSSSKPPRIRLRWRRKGMDGDFGPHQLSDGTLRLMLLTTLLHQPKELLPPIIAIDEPELGLHPAALNIVAGLIRAASHQSQMIVATQSSALLDNFTPDDVVVVHRENGASTLQRLSPAELQEWLTDYSLGELWEKNVFGGGPFG